MRRTGIATPESRVTAWVLQAKTGLVSLGHFASSDGVQQVVVTEGVHAVVVSLGVEQNRVEKNKSFLLVGRLKQIWGMSLRLQFYVISELNGAFSKHNTCRLSRLTGDSCASPTDILAWQEGSHWCLGSSLSGGTAGGLWSQCLWLWVHRPTLNGSQGTLVWDGLESPTYWDGQSQSAKGLFHCAQGFWENQSRTFMSWQDIMLENHRSTLISNSFYKSINRTVILSQWKVRCNLKLS